MLDGFLPDRRAAATIGRNAFVNRAINDLREILVRHGPVELRHVN